MRSCKRIFVHVGITDIIAFNVINTPGSVELQQGIIVKLSFRKIAYTVHIRIPAADDRRIGNVFSTKRTVLDLSVMMCSDSRNTAHDVNSEFQPQTVYIVGKWFKAGTVCRRWKTFGIRQQTGVFVHFQFREWNILIPVAHGTGLFCIPLDIHYNILPAICF